MKDNDAFYVQGHGGGHLEPQYHEAFARYMARYVADYAAAGVPIWAVTPENEPLGVGGQWESMEMSPEELVAAGITDCMVRFSIGVEAWEDLLEDIRQALNFSTIAGS